VYRRFEWMQESGRYTLFGSGRDDGFVPSANIAHAIEALKNLPDGFAWTFGKRASDFAPKRKFCLIWDANDMYLAETTGEHSAEIICRALLDKRVLKAVRKARKDVQK